MSTIAVGYSNKVRFDVIEYIKKLRNLGVSQEVAELQAQELEHVIDITTNSSKELKAELKAEIKQELHADDLVTKKDLGITKLELQKEIEVVRKEIEIVRKEIEVVRKEIVQSKNQTLIWTFGMLTGFATFLLGAMAKGFHWW
ncbi:MAG: hypothetical protein K0R14_1666 [Burkholderiales bacterium]|jgi:hypothetical protein|nr:hypothetical protein [Burkholderiales bacterium]